MLTQQQDVRDLLTVGLTQSSWYLEAVRNYDDLTCLACPDKYKQLNTFWRYYSGSARAPYLTLFSEFFSL